MTAVALTEDRQTEHHPPEIRLSQTGVPSPVLDDNLGFDQWASDLTRVFGTENEKLALTQLQLLSQAAANISSDRETVINALIAAISDIAPRDILESQLACQIECVHLQSMHFLKQSANSGFPETAQKYLNLAIRLMRMYLQQIEALGKYRQGKRRMSVGQVVVNAEQAIVGNVESTGQK